jgi:hypothetical protein
MAGRESALGGKRYVLGGKRGAYRDEYIEIYKNRFLSFEMIEI